MVSGDLYNKWVGQLTDQWQSDTLYTYIIDLSLINVIRNTYLMTTTEDHVSFTHLHSGIGDFGETPHYDITYIWPPLYAVFAVTMDDMQITKSRCMYC